MTETTVNYYYKFEQVFGAAFDESRPEPANPNEMRMSCAQDLRRWVDMRNDEELYSNITITNVERARVPVSDYSMAEEHDYSMAEEHLVIMRALTSTTVDMRKPGDWHACMHAKVRGSTAILQTTANGKTPGQAIEALWKQVTKADTVLILRAFTCHVKGYRWDGSTWQEVSL